MKVRQKIKAKWIAALLAAFLILGSVCAGPAALHALAQEEGENPAPEQPSAPEPAPPQPTKPPAPTAAPPSPSPSPSPTPEAANSSAPEQPGVPDPTDTSAPAPDQTPGEGGSPATAKPEDTQNSGNTPGTAATADPEATIGPEATMDPNLEDQSPDDAEEDGAGLVMLPKRSSSWRGTAPSDKRGMAIPVLYQFDYKEAVCTYNDIARSVATSGCGATSASMVIAYLTGNTNQNPYTLFYRAAQMGRYHGSGLGHETISWMLRENGVQSKWIANNGNAIKNALQEGKPVIAHMGPGIFTEQGHYIVLRGVTEDGRILLNDPNSASRTCSTYSIETILEQARGSNAFLVCWTDTPAEIPAPDAEEAIAEESDGAAENIGEAESAAELPAIVAAARGLSEAEPKPTAQAAPTFEIVVDATLEPSADGI